MSLSNLASWTTDDIFKLAATIAALSVVVLAPIWVRRSKALEQLAETAENRAEREQGRQLQQAAIERDAAAGATFARAVDQLSSPRLTTRLGGIYTLERLARLSPAEREPALEVLAAFLRENAAWDPEAEPAPAAAGEAAPEAAAEAEIPAPPAPGSVSQMTPRADVQAAIMVLGRREIEGDGDPMLDLRGVDLRACVLKNANLEKANLSGANLNGAMLLGVNFRGSFLWGVKLAGTRLTKVNFQDANLFRADFSEATFQGCNLAGADLAGAIFGRTKLAGAKGLTPPQLAGAQLDGETELPDYLSAA